MMVIAQSSALARCPRASHHPHSRTQITLPRRLRVRPAAPEGRSMTSRPNGQKEKVPMRKAATAHGIPMMVMAERIAASHQLSPMRRPPNTNQMILPIKRIDSPFFGHPNPTVSNPARTGQARIVFCRYFAIVKAPRKNGGGATRWRSLSGAAPKSPCACWQGSPESRAAIYDHAQANTRR